MSAHQQVGDLVSFTATSSSVQSTAIPQKTQYLRVVAIDQDAHVAIGTNPTATTANYYDSAVTGSIVTAVNETYEPNADSGYCRRITLAANTTSIATAYSSSNYAELRNVFKVAGIRGGGTNAVVKVQQIQVVGG